MSDLFLQMANGVSTDGQSTSASPETNQDLNQSSQAPQPNAQDSAPKGDVAMAIAELDKMDKFKLDGQEWTLKDLKAAIMRQKDYTQKTQNLAEERKSFQEERKFHENLAWDLQTIRESKPEEKQRLVQEFLKIYPQKFHSHAEKFLSTNTPNQTQVPSQQVQQPQVDVKTLSRLERLEKFYHEQEVAREEVAIERTMDELSKQYPDAAKFQKYVMATALEARMAGSELDRDTWEQIFKQVDEEVKATLKAQYGEKVKQQLDANAKGKDVGAGGGTAGRAPVPKFKSFDELDKFAQSTLKGAG